MILLNYNNNINRSINLCILFNIKIYIMTFVLSPFSSQSDQDKSQLCAQVIHDMTIEFILL